MIIVSKNKKAIINFDNITAIEINKGDQTRIEIMDTRGVIRLLATYEDEEVTKTVFNQIIEAFENSEEIFYMPE